MFGAGGNRLPAGEVGIFCANSETKFISRKTIVNLADFRKTKEAYF